MYKINNRYTNADNSYMKDSFQPWFGFMEFQSILNFVYVFLLIQICILLARMPILYFAMIFGLDERGKFA